MQTSEETGLPGRPSTRACPRRPNINGLPGRMAIFQNASAMPRASSTGRDEVVIADRGAADGDDDVGVVRALAKWASRLSRVSRAMPSSCGLGAGRFGQRGDAQMIGGDDLAGPGRLPGRHQLVAGREDGDARAAAHR